MWKALLHHPHRHHHHSPRRRPYHVNVTWMDQHRRFVACQTLTHPKRLSAITAPAAPSTTAAAAVIRRPEFRRPASSKCFLSTHAAAVTADTCAVGSVVVSSSTWVGHKGSGDGATPPPMLLLHAGRHHPKQPPLLLEEQQQQEQRRSEMGRLLVDALLRSQSQMLLWPSSPLSTNSSTLTLTSLHKTKTTPIMASSSSLSSLPLLSSSRTTSTKKSKTSATHLFSLGTTSSSTAKFKTKNNTTTTPHRTTTTTTMMPDPYSNPFMAHSVLSSSSSSVSAWSWSPPYHPHNPEEYYTTMAAHNHHESLVPPSLQPPSPSFQFHPDPHYSHEYYNYHHTQQQQHHHHHPLSFASMPLQPPPPPQVHILPQPPPQPPVIQDIGGWPLSQLTPSLPPPKRNRPNTTKTKTKTMASSGGDKPQPPQDDESLRLVLEFHKAMEAKNLVWAIQVMDDACNIRQRQERAARDHAEREWQRQQRQQQQAQGEDHGSSTPKTTTKTTTTTTNTSNSNSNNMDSQHHNNYVWEMPIPLKSVRQLFYVAFEQRNALAAYHILRNYIWWDQQIKHGQKQKKQKQQPKNGPDPTKTTSSLFYLSSSSSPLAPPKLRPSKPLKQQRNHQYSDQFLLKSELEALQRQEQEEEVEGHDHNHHHLDDHHHSSGNNHDNDDDDYFLDEYKLFFRHWIHCLEGMNFATRSTSRTRQHDRHRVEKMVQRIRHDWMRYTSPAVQEYLWPKLLVALLTQTAMPQLGGATTCQLFHAMQQQGYAVVRSGPYLEHLLSTLSYNRRKDLPWHLILHTLAFDLQHTMQRPEIVVQLLSFMYPYTDLEPTHSVLASLKQLIQTEQQQQQQQRKREQQQHNQVDEEYHPGQDQNENTTSRKGRTQRSAYHVDMAILELASSAAARAGSYETVLLIWELLELLHLPPSAALYENIILAFAQRGPTCYEHVFALLGEMELQAVPTTMATAATGDTTTTTNNNNNIDADSYIPSRALIRGLSTRMRRTHYNAKKSMDHLLEAVQNHKQRPTEIPPVTVAAFNVVLSALAERGMVGDLQVIMDVLRRYVEDRRRHHDGVLLDTTRLHPNADTFSFLLEGLGKNLLLAKEEDPYNSELGLRQKRVVDDKMIQWLVRTADAFLSEMEDVWQLEPTQHIIKEYVELLVLAGDLETATDMILNALDQGQVHLISSKALYRLSRANAQHGRTDIAQRLALAGCDKPVDLTWFPEEEPVQDENPHHPNRHRHRHDNKNDHRDDETQMPDDVDRLDWAANAPPPANHGEDKKETTPPLSWSLTSTQVAAAAASVAGGAAAVVAAAVFHGPEQPPHEKESHPVWGEHGDHPPDSLDHVPLLPDDVEEEEVVEVVVVVDEEEEEL